MEVQLETGELNRFITIQSVPETKDAAGYINEPTPVDVWLNVAAKFLSITGRESEQARQMSGMRDGIVETRYIPGITREHQFVLVPDEGQVFEIVLVDDVGHQHVKLHLHYREVA